MLHDELQTLILQLGGQEPDLLGPLHLREAPDQLLTATQRGHGAPHRLQGNIDQLRDSLTVHSVSAQDHQSDASWLGSALSVGQERTEEHLSRFL